MEKEKAKKLLIIAIVVLGMAVLGVSFAYFSAQGGTSTSADVNVTTYTTDQFTFTVGEPISIEASQRTFGENMGSISDSTFAQATLKANNKTNEVTDSYTLYLNIINNTFIYTQEDKSPEIVLTVTDEEGNEVEISTLNKVEVQDNNGNIISGYDVTEEFGIITLFGEREMTTTSEKTEKWNVKVTFVNYDKDQSNNEAKEFNAKLVISKKVLKESFNLANACKSGQTLSSCIIATSGKDPNLYHHDGTLKNGINDGSYRYAGGNTHPNYYSCTYDGNDVINYEKGEINYSSKDDCSNVYEVNEKYVIGYYDKSFEDTHFNTAAVKWDSENNVCVTTDGAEVIDGNDIYITVKKNCTGLAYQYGNEDIYVLGITKLGAGKSSSDGNSCTYDGYEVKSFTDSAIDCSTVYKIESTYNWGYYDRTIKNYINTTSSVKWDSTNDICVTESGYSVVNWEGFPVNQINCTGTAYENKDEQVGFKVDIIAAGAGVENPADGVDNYVCFGSDDATCPEDNLYRIIGVFGDQVKLIKASPASSTLLGTSGDYSSGTSYYWNYKNNKSINSGYGSNTWSTSFLNKTNLNTNYITYLNNINTKWAKMIATTTWKVGGNTYDNIAGAVPKIAYANEITNPVTTNSTDSATTYSAKIGLMYVSDYGFAASSSAWTTALSSYNSSSITSVNWMYLGSNELTISRYSDYSDGVFIVDSGRVLDDCASSHSAVRPVFYLTSTATYSGGGGTSDNPYRLG